MLRPLRDGHAAVHVGHLLTETLQTYTHTADCHMSLMLLQGKLI